MVDSVSAENDKVSIIISNFQGRQYLPECLESLKKQTYKNYEIIVVDAGSQDGSQEFIRNRYPQIELIECDRIGLGEAINIGMRHSTGDILCFDLNTDEYVFDNWLEELIKKLRQHEYNIIAGATRLINGTNLIDEAGVDINFFGAIEKNGHGINVENFRCSGSKTDFVGSPVFHRRLLNLIGMIDEAYYIYAEDLDFCFRAKLLGIETHFAFGARSRHQVKGTTGKNPEKREYLLRRAHIRFMIIHSTRAQMIFRLIFACIVLPLAALIRSAFNRRDSQANWLKFSGRIQAVIWNIRNIRDTLIKREHYDAAGRG